MDWSMGAFDLLLLKRHQGLGGQTPSEHITPLMFYHWCYTPVVGNIYIQ